MVAAPLGAIRELPHLSLRGSAYEIRFHPGTSLVDPSDAVGCRKLTCRAAMVIPDPSRLPRSVGEVLSTGQLPETMTDILAIRFRMVREDGGGSTTRFRCYKGFFIGIDYHL